MTTFTLEGSAVRDIPTFYDEINRVFMADADWRLGPSLDALNDLLFGGVGALAGVKDVRIVWVDHAVSRSALGRDATARHYRAKLLHPETFNADHFGRLLDELQHGTGRTYFDIVLEIFGEHSNIELVLE